MTEPVTSALLATVLLPAVYLDITTSRIPNWLTFMAMGMALLANSLEGAEGALFSLSGLVTGFFLFLTFYLFGHMGAGDVKLMGSVGAVVGPYGALVAGLSAVIVGGVYALAAMSYEWGVTSTVQKLASQAYRTLFQRDTCMGNSLNMPYQLRYAVAIAGGTLLYRFGLHPFGG